MLPPTPRLRARGKPPLTVNASGATLCRAARRSSPEPADWELCSPRAERRSPRPGRSDGRGRGAISWSRCGCVATAPRSARRIGSPARWSAPRVRAGDVNHRGDPNWATSPATRSRVRRPSALADHSPTGCLGRRRSPGSGCRDPVRVSQANGVTISAASGTWPGACPGRSVLMGVAGCLTRTPGRRRCRGRLPCCRGSPGTRSASAPAPGTDPVEVPEPAPPG